MSFKGAVIYIAGYSVILGALWGAGTLFARSVRDVEVIHPAIGVSCAVVSRMFNTSIACWNDAK